jgi:hypothetical protein
MSCERAFEKKFEIDQELKFKVTIRTARLFGLWAAEQMGLKDTAAETYARQAVEAAMTKSGPEYLIDKIEKDFTAKGISLSRRRLEQEIGAFHRAARAQMMGEG